MNKESHTELVTYSKVRRVGKKKKKTRTGVPHETLRFSVLEHAQDRRSQTPVTRELKNWRAQRKNSLSASTFSIKGRGEKKKKFPPFSGTTGCKKTTTAGEADQTCDSLGRLVAWSPGPHADTSTHAAAYLFH